MRSENQTSVEMRSENQTTRSSCDQRTRPAPARWGAIIFVLLSFVVLLGRGPLMRGLLSLGGPLSRLRLLAKDHPGSDPLVAHWPQNDAFSHLAPGQNETLREHANSADNSSSSVVVGIVISVKILSIK